MPLTKLTAGLEVTAVTDLKKLLEEVSKSHSLWWFCSTKVT